MDIVYDCSINNRDLAGETDLDLNNVTRDEILVFLDCLNDMNINIDAISSVDEHTMEMKTNDFN